MHISSSSNNSERLQEDLSEYGILREDAKKGLRAKGVDSKLFGIKRTNKDTKLIFTDAPEKLVEEKAQLAIVAPEFDSFDMLVTRNFKKAVSIMTDSDSIRQFVSRIVDKA